MVRISATPLSVDLSETTPANILTMNLPFRDFKAATPLSENNIPDLTRLFKRPHLAKAAAKSIFSLRRQNTSRKITNMAIEELKILTELLPELRQNASVTRGPGDDCAVLKMPEGSGSELLAAVDQLARDVHYTADTPPEAAGEKLLKRNLSDIAAMGGVPRWALLTVAAGGRDAEWVLRFCRGVAKYAGNCGIPVVGGDLAGLKADTEVATLTILGEVPTGRAVLRSGARPGDGLYVTGKIGNSFRSRHHLTFRPRLAEGEFLRGKATAMLDVSDGLLLDAGRLARASQVDLFLDADLVPLRDGAVLPGALSDGEDYELLFTAPPGLKNEWSDGLAPLTRIGEVRDGTGRVIDKDGKEYNSDRAGYEH